MGQETEEEGPDKATGVSVQESRGDIPSAICGAE